MLEVFIITILFVLGAAIGSFINMLVYRVDADENILGRSYCDKTKQQLGALDLIPVFSYIFHRGKCRKCGVKLPVAYPIIEFITGLLTVISYIQISGYDLSNTQLALNLFIVLVFVYTLLYFAAYDYFYWSVHLLSILIALGYILLITMIGVYFDSIVLSDIWSHIAAAGLGALMLGSVVLITKGGGMGEGDIFLIALIGLMVGIEGLFWAFMISVITGSLFGIILMIKKRQRKGLLIQFAPFLSFGGIMLIVFRFEILDLISRLLFTGYLY